VPGQLVEGEVLVAGQVRQDVLAGLGALGRAQLAEVAHHRAERGHLGLEVHVPLHELR
jgi:hypothetical protein